MRYLITILFLFPVIVYSQTNTSTPNQDFGNTQNNIMGSQGRTFGGGSIVKPNPMLTSADFALIGSNTYEPNQPAFRPGTAIGYSKINKGNGFGFNGMFTFDFSQKTISLFYKRQNWYFHYNTGMMAITKNTSVSVTRMFECEGITMGTQLGVAKVTNGPKEMIGSYYVLVPYMVLIAQKEIKINKILNWQPETFITLCSPYYDIGLKSYGKSSTFNAVVGNELRVKVSKSFKLNLNWRMNINTTPKLGIMHNILIGGNYDF